MLAVVPSATLFGLDGRPIRVEVDVAPGLPGFTVVGLADTAVQEARERVRGAIRNSGFAFPPRRLTVNLGACGAPQDGRVARSGDGDRDPARVWQVRAGPAAVAFIGELGLDGEMRPVPGILPMAAALADRGHRAPRAWPTMPSRKPDLVSGIEVIGAATLAAAGRDRPTQAPGAPTGRETTGERPATLERSACGQCPSRAMRIPDLREVRGQAGARRALEIALAVATGC
jgi:magnesium chelatase family protein